jgi:hypothetical protein
MAAARRRDEEKNAAGGKDIYFLTGEERERVLQTMIDDVFATHREEYLEARKTWQPNCYCEPGEDYCGGLCACGAPAHMQHFPGPFPATGAWCDDCSFDIAFLVEKLEIAISSDGYEAAAKRRRALEKD